MYYTELQKKQTMIWMPFQIILYFLCNFDVIILKAIYMLFFSKYDIIPLKNPQYHNKSHNPKLPRILTYLNFLGKGTFCTMNTTN